MRYNLILGAVKRSGAELGRTEKGKVKAMQGEIELRLKELWFFELGKTEEMVSNA